MDPLTFPIFLNVRDRVTDLRKLVAWLENAGHQRIIILDNQSTYEPLTDYLKQSPHEVRYLRHNYGSRALWQTYQMPNTPFILSDPDLTPTDECPFDLVDHLWELMQRLRYRKAGVGLMLDDCPDDMPSLGWERSLVSTEREIEPGVYDSLVDTTFALYDTGTNFQYEAIRTGSPYLFRHTPWYITQLDHENTYYLSRANYGDEGTTWHP